jgi:hypothetical protein
MRAERRVAAGAVRSPAANASAACGTIATAEARPPSGQADGASLTHVSLAYVERRLVLSLRFGEPDDVLRLDAYRRVALFGPGAVFCRTCWRAGVAGAASRQLMVMQAGTPLDRVPRVPGVQPGARVLLQAHGSQPVRAVLARIDAIEALGIAPQDAAPLYWLALGHRLSVRRPLPAYSVEQHLAWRAGRASR